MKNFITNNQCIIIYCLQKLSFGCPALSPGNTISVFIYFSGSSRLVFPAIENLQFIAMGVRQPLVELQAANNDAGGDTDLLSEYFDQGE
ncbi:MAG: hypothetical protein BECKG1743D_GA0114223_106593 [Candidatus Kentron sp. G]|nr:MAG: hypothetical protein BECKG1743D_GA0114223_106593 [Candidatus Kentron sp. G]VFN05629.1 MAG: hypothetical protein BECKG1743E_GA0114224_108922 [Candidatus Kentron sp. G]